MDVVSRINQSNFFFYSKLVSKYKSRWVEDYPGGWLIGLDQFQGTLDLIPLH